MKEKNRYRYIKLLVMFLIISMYSLSTTAVSSASALSSALSNASENLIVLTANISLSANLTIAERTGGNLTIDGNGYTVSMGGSNLNLDNGLNDQNLTLKNFKATGNNFIIYENTTLNKWNIFLDGTNDITTSFEVMFRSDDSTSNFTALPGSNNTLTGTGGKTPFGLIESYGNVTIDNSHTTINTVKGSAFYYRDLWLNSRNRTINVINGGTLDIIGHSAIYAPDYHYGTSDDSNINVNVVGSGSKLTANTKEITFNSGSGSYRSDINLLAKDGGTITASTNVNGKDVFYGGMNPTITADNGTIDLSSNGSKVVNFYDRTGTIEAKNNGSININGNTSGSVVQIDRSGNYQTTDVTSIHSSTGGDIIIKNAGIGTGVVANGNSILKVTSEDSGSKIEMNTSGNTFTSDRSGTEIVAKNSGEISFTSNGVNSTNIVLSDSANNSVVSALNGGEIKIDNSGSGNATGIAINEKPVNLTVQGNNSSLDIDIPNGTGTSYGINLSTNTGQQITVDDSGKLDINIKSTGIGIGINSTVGLMTSVTDQSNLTIENASNSGVGINVTGGSTNTFGISGNGTTVKVENTTSSNTSSAINITGSLNLGSGSNLYTLNTSSSSASINATTGITFTSPGEFNIQNNSTSGRAVDSISTTTLALNNTSIIMWDNDKAPSYAYGDQYDAWKNLTANLLDNGSTSLATGISKSNSTVNLSQMGRLTNLVSGTPVITKSTTDTTYIPGGTITYKIIVNNPDFISFLNIKDVLVNQTTTDVNGTSINAFSSWSYTSSETGVGFTVGNTPSGSGTINDLLTMVGDSTVTYTVTAIVNTKAAGNILNTATATVNGTTTTAVSNNSTPKVGTVVSKKTTTSTTYAPGEEITYTLTETNSGGKSTVKVEDLIASQKTTDAGGTSIDAFSSWSYTSSVSGTGSVSGNTASGSSDITDTLTMTGDVVVTYTIKAKVSLQAAGDIKNTAKVTVNGVTGDVVSEVITPKVGTVVSKKTTTSTTYAPGEEITYTLTETNSGGKSTVKVEDLIASQKTTDAGGTSINAFSSWSYTSSVSGTGSVSGNAASGSSDITDTLTMTGDVVVTYTIKAKVSLQAAGDIKNTAKVTVNGVTGDVVSEVITPKVGTVVSKKTTTSTTYAPGEEITYTLTETNSGGKSTVKVEDLIASQKTTDAGGTSINAFSSWSYTSSVSGTGSVSGNTASGSSDITDTLTMTGDVVVTYTIKAKVSLQAAGDIKNTAKVTVNGVTGDVVSEVITPKVGTVVSKKTTTSTTYAPGEEITYTLTETNSGGKSTVKVEDLIASQKTTDAGGTSINAFSSWSYTSSVSGTGSVSGNTASGNSDIIDTLTMTGDVVVTYTIKAKVSLQAAGDIKNTAKVTVNGVTGDVVSEVITPKVGTVVSKKTTTSTTYAPGEEITYTLTETNSGGKSTVKVEDLIASQKTTDAGGTSINAFSSWSYTSSVSGTGSVSGNTASGNSDIIDTLTMTGDVVVTYTIKAKVSLQAAGDIKNTAKVTVNGVTGDVVSEVITPKVGTVVSKKTTTSTTYAPGEEITYTLTETNSGGKSTVKVEDLIASQKTTDAGGTSINAFSSWSYTSSVSGTGSVSGNTASGNSDIIDTLTMTGDVVVTYTIKAKVSLQAAGDIKNTAKVTVNGVTGDVVSEVITPKVGTVVSKKTTTSTTYAPGEEITYTLTETNSGGKSTVKVEDLIASQKTTDAGGTSINAFSSWSYTSSVSGTGSVSGNTASGNSDIIDTLTMTGDVVVTYTIKAKVSLQAAGDIKNTAKVTVNGVTGDVVSEVITPKVGTVVSKKTTTSTTYAPGEEITYTLTETNSGGKSTVKVEDLIASQKTTDAGGTSINAFSSWSYTSSVSGTGSVSGNTASGNSDIIDTLTMTGDVVVTYTIKAKVSLQAAGDIKNTAKVTVNGVTGDVVSEVITPKVGTVVSKKTTTSTTYAPGEEITYTLTETNSGGKSTVKVEDLIASQKTTDAGGTSINAFSSWSYTSSVSGTGSVSGNTASGNSDIIDTLTMTGDVVVTYTIKAKVSLQAAGDIKNTAKVTVNGVTGDVVSEVITPKVGTVVSKKTTTSTTYAPGEEITYTLTETNSGGKSTVKVEDLIASQKTTDAGGTSINAFSSWSYTSSVSGTGSVSGNTASGNSDIIDTLTMTGDVVVTYTIKAKVSLQAAGDIKNTAKVTVNGVTGDVVSEVITPKVGTVVSKKTTTSTTYAPGEEITYTLTETNSGGKSTVKVEDLIASQKTTDAGGTSINAFSSWSYTSSVSGTGSVSGNTASGNSDIIDTLTMTGDVVVTYTIKAKVSLQAAGDIKNTAKVTVNGVTGDVVSEVITPKVGTVVSKKTTTSTTYAPGEEITYTLTETNSGGKSTVKVEDLIASQKTTDAGGTSINAFSSWSYTSSVSGTGSVSGNTASGNSDIIDTLTMTGDVVVTYTIKAKVSLQAAGDIKNTAKVTVNGVTGDVVSEVITPKVGTVVSKKTTTSTTYAPGEEITYTLTETNSGGKSTVKVEDLIASQKTTDAGGTSINAFSSWSYTSSVSGTGSVSGNTASGNSDIIDTLTMTGDVVVTYTIKAKVSLQAAGDIKNTAKVTVNGVTGDVVSEVITPKVGTVVSKKTTTSTTYAPGEEITYTLTETNSGGKSTVKVEDLIASQKTTDAGGTSINAFSSWSYTSSVSGTGSVSGNTASGNSDIIDTLTMTGDVVVTYTIKAKVSLQAAGDIKNTAKVTVNGVTGDVVSEVITPKVGTVVSKKTTTSTTYAPGEEITYTLTETNSGGKSTVKVEDLIASQKTTDAGGTSINAFSSWSYTSSVSGTGSVSGNTASGNSDIIDTLTMTGDVVVTYTIKAKVSLQAAGDIKNTAKVTVNGVTGDVVSEVITPKVGTVVSKKTTTSTTYAPGEEITYTLTETNSGGKSTVKVEDLIASQKTTDAGGTSINAFSSWSYTSSVSGTGSVSGNTASGNSDIIDTLTMTGDVVVTYTIKAKVSLQAAGDIKNTAKVTVNGVTGDVVSEVITPKVGTVVSKKTTTSTTYAPGEEITYTLTETNSGGKSTVKVEDLIASQKTTDAGGTSINAFSSWSYTSSVSGTGSVSGNTASGNSDIIDTLTMTGDVVVTYTIKAKVSLQAAGDIKNTAKVTVNGVTGDVVSEVITPKVGTVVSKKTTTSTTYAPGEEITYTLTETNSGGKSTVKVEDLIASQKTTDAGGTSINAFSSWSYTSSVSGTGSVSGNTASGNSDIIDTLTMTGDVVVTYTIKAKVSLQAAGDIKNTAKVTVNGVTGDVVSEVITPKVGTVVSKKTTTSTTYAPGEEITYTLTETNSGGKSTVKVEDLIASQKTTDAGGTSINAFSSWSYTSSVSGTGSVSGNTASGNSDIIDTLTMTGDVVVTYTIKAKVSLQAAGDIKNTAKVTVNGVTGDVVSEVITPKVGTVVSKKTTTSTTYAPGEEITYTLTETNSGGKSTVKVEDLIASQKTTDAGGTSINAFSSWSYTSSVSGTGSVSGNTASGNSDIIDTLTMTGDVVVTYTIKAKVSLQAAGDIKNTAKVTVNGVTGDVVSEVITPKVGTVVSKKTTTSTTYAPGEEITYTLTETNSGGKSTVKVEDLIASQKTTDAGGTSINAFSSWSYTSSVSGTGSVSGNTASGNSDIIDTLTMTGDVVVTYTIKAKVSLQAAGDIKNTAKVTVNGVTGDVVSEVITPKVGTVVSKKTTTSTTYAPGEEITYTLTETNSGGKSTVKVEDLIASQKTTDAGGTSINAFSSWSYTSSVSGTGSVSGNTASGNSDIIDTLTMTGDVVVTYTIKAKVSLQAAGDIKNTAKVTVNGVTGDVVSEVITPKVGTVVSKKTTTSTTYAPGEEITYTLTETNSGGKSTVKVEDLIASQKTTDAGGTSINAFSSWSYTSSVSGTGSVSGNTASGNSDIIDTLTMTGDVVVTYTIKAKVSLQAAGDIKNTAKVTVNGVTGDVVSEVITPKVGTVVSKKTTTSTTYAPGEEITYTLTETNSGGKSTVKVEDLIASQKTTDAGGTSINAFSSWSYTSSVSGTGSVSGNTASGNSDIIDTLTMTGDVVVTYTIKAKVSLQAAGDIKNTAKVTVNGVTGDVVSEVITPKVGTVVSKKTTTSTTYAPGEEITYTLTETNSGGKSTVKVEDLIASQKTTDAGGTSINAFSSWSYTSSVSGTGSVSGNTASGNSDIIDTLTMTGDVVVTYTIKAKVSLQAAGDIKNTAKVTVNGVTGDVVSEVITPKVGTVVSKKTTTSTTYAPGEEITYTLTETNSGGKSTVKVEDLIASQKTTDAGGTSINAFSSWSYTSSVSGTGSVSGNTASGNSDIIDTLTMTGDVVVTYTIKAKVSLQAAGDIKNTAKVTVNGVTGDVVSEVITPKVGTVVSKKTTTSTTYAPGEEITYTLTETNSGGKSTVKVEDLIASQKTTDAGGTSINAFSSWSYTSSVSGTGSVSGNTASGNSDIIDTLTMTGDVVVTYTIKAKVSLQAAGDIKNTAKVTVNGVTGDVVSEVITPKVGTVVSKKTTTSTTYAPGEEITYTLTETNSGGKSTVKVEDLIASQKTTDAGGTSINAFSSWSYTSSVSGTGSVSGNTASGNSDITDTLTMTGDVVVTYTIKAIVNTKAAGEIKNTASVTVNGVTGDVVSEVITPKVGTVVSKKTTTSTTYAPGEEITYTITETNSGGKSTVKVEDLIASQETTDAGGTSINAFSSWSYTSSVSGTGSVSGNTSSTTGNNDIKDTLTMTGDVVVTYTIKAIVNTKAAGDIKNTAKVTVNGVTGDVVSEVITPKVGTVSSSKNTDSKTYLPGDTILFTLSETNTGGRSTVVIKDILADQKTTNADGASINAFSSWSYTSSVSGTGSVSGNTASGSSDITDTLTMAGDVVVTYTITAIVSTSATGDVANTAKVTSNGVGSIDVTDPDGPLKIGETGEMMSLIKSASTDLVTSGGVAVYTVSITNNTSMIRDGFYIYDTAPSGFTYVNESAVAIYADGTKAKVTPTIGEKLVFGPYSLGKGETLILTYAMKVSSTLPSGTYKNLAVAKLSGKDVSNVGSAAIKVTVDTFIDSATIIGKVFMDVDGDNVQDSAEATKVELTNFDTSNFVEGSGTVTTYNTRGIETSSLPLEYDRKSVQIVKAIDGISFNGKDYDVNFVKIRVQLKDEKIPTSYTVKTMEGMILDVRDGVADYSRSVGIYSTKMTSQALNIKTKVVEEERKIYLEIVITNTGIQEDGIAGVRLVTPEGYTVITDEFGRYHLPDKIVEKLRGTNVVVKVDSSTLPSGTKVISENPASKLVTGSALNVIDFAVQTDKQEGK